jgi:hypothetical protein
MALRSLSATPFDCTYQTGTWSLELQLSKPLIVLVYHSWNGLRGFVGWETTSQ